MATSQEEWVEILEPTSREKMFANLGTGEIVLTPPEGVQVKPMSENQWWELYDQGSESYYYYNAHTGDTIWNKPEDGADIISLTKLQSGSSDGLPVQQDSDLGPLETVREEETEEHTAKEEPDYANLGPDTDRQPFSGSVSKSVQPLESTASSTITPPKTSPAEKKKLSGIFSNDLEPLSPLTVDYGGHRFSSFDSSSLDKPNSDREQIRTEAADSSHGGATTADLQQNSRTLRPTADGGNSRYVEHDRGSWVNIQLMKNGASYGGNGEERLSVDNSGRYSHGSLDRSSRGRDQLSVNSGSYDAMKSRTLEMPGRKKQSFHGSTPAALTPVRPAPTPPSLSKAPDAKLKSPSRRSSMPQGSIPKSKSVDLNSPEHEKVKKKRKPVQYHSRNNSDGVPPKPPPAAPKPPPLKPVRPEKTDKPVESLENFKELAQHRKGLFRKKVTIANMLSWTKEPIKQPMIMTRDKQLKKEACDLFKLLLQFMGDKKSKAKNVNQIALEITSRAWEKKGLRDELYIQLCRQTSANTNGKSLERGWQMFAISLAFFPPSIKFRSYLEGYLWRHVEPLPEYRGVRIEVYAQYCHKKVEKMTQSGAKKGLKKPTLEEVEHAKQAPFNPSMFGATLEEVMELQKEKFPDYSTPWVVEALADAVLQLHGPQTEGIFRVPGDIDEVNALKLKVDKGLIPIETLHDPHVPASLMKLWFRELEDPLIPAEYYDECINNSDNQANALSLVDSLPDLNRELLIYLVKFLKQFITPGNIEATKMGIDNIAMVWAPNFLRCPSDDHTLIFQNTRKEMAFLRLLLKFLDIDGEDGDLS